MKKYSFLCTKLFSPFVDWLLTTVLLAAAAALLVELYNKLVVGSSAGVVAREIGDGDPEQPEPGPGLGLLVMVGDTRGCFGGARGGVG